MVYVRYKSIKSSNGNKYIYLVLVENNWVPGKGPRQKVLSYIGKAKTNGLLKEVIKEVYERDCFKCVDCGKTTDLTLDHLISPLDGGSNDADNLQVRCVTCNKKRGRKKP